MAAVTVIIPSIREREDMLREACASVDAQTFTDRVKHIIIDGSRKGCAWSVNHAAAQVESEWLFILADDDLMLPGCLATHMAASADADIVYAPPLVWGAEAGPYRQGFPCIPSASLIRTSLWRELGGYDESLTREEDRDFYLRAQVAGARVVRVADQPTWIYRIHDGSKSWAGMERRWAA